MFSSSEKEEPEKKGGGVKFTLGEQADEDEEEEEVVFYPPSLLLRIFSCISSGFQFYMMKIFGLRVAFIFYFFLWNFLFFERESFF